MGSICSTNVKEVIPESYFVHRAETVLVNDEREVPREEEKSPAKIFELPRSHVKKSGIDVKSNQHQILEVIEAVVTMPQKNHFDLQMLRHALRSHFIFKSLNEDNIDSVIQQMKLYTLEENTQVFAQGAPASTFFVVQTGKCHVHVNGKKCTELKRGDGFGELALLHDSPRSATVIAVEDTCLWGVDRLSFRKVLEKINKANYEENKLFIDHVPMLAHLSEKQKELMVDNLVTLKFSPGQVIVVEDDPGDLLYIIKSGTVVCMKNKQYIRRMQKGDFFGEQSLLFNCMRTATIVAEDDVKCLSLGRKRLKHVLGDRLQNIIYRNLIVQAMELNNELKLLTKEQAYAVVEKMQIKSIPPGEVIIPSGTEEHDTIRILLKGFLRFGDSTIESPTCLGTACLTEGCRTCYVFDVVSQGECEIAVVSKSAVEETIGGTYSSVVDRNKLINVMKQVQLFRALTPKAFEKLVKAATEQSFPENHMIIEENGPATSFFIVKTGKVDVCKNGKVVRSICKHDYFGERAILDDSIRSATVISVGPSVCWMINKEVFLEIIDKNMMRKLQRRMMLQDDTVELRDLFSVQPLGQGMFGQVILTVHREKQTLYALKAVNRAKVARYDMFSWLQLEREILLQLDHEFIMKLVRTFKDSDYIYFLTEFVNGVDFFQVLRYTGALRESDAQFYSQCLLLVLTHLNSREIAYRDMKPENIMVDEEGYPKMIDFGTAKALSGRTFTVVGTPQYMAPEVILGNGYSFTVDYWSLAIMIFEMMSGKLPFGENLTDPYEVYEEVLEGELKFPVFFDHRQELKDLLSKMLDRDPSERFSGPQLITHPWFRHHDPEALLCRRVKAPYLPRLKNLGNDIRRAISRSKRVKTALKSKLDPEDLVRSEEPAGWDANF
eukprot:CAMPEP_0204896828 /NCGR_PEP_ID=MMETSP1397-20131031/385_1 /ASSEMBLY_ACC=CAM_ASM_000891 /TAXON_ID=49980 /ORGANISM="Climacostomum Climacostomum virens, Strain Stock W-24" /LENGTH=891 /DNA_ID=CAMNT_0052064493 /DNA_START=685 /DNA_END=3360 /DNA_ORIENTATION=-